MSIEGMTYVESEDGHDYTVEIHSGRVLVILDGEGEVEVARFGLSQLVTMGPTDALSLDVGAGRYIDAVGMWNIRRLADL